MRQGLMDGISLGLDLRFGIESLRLLPEISEIRNTALLRAIREGLKTIKSAEELRRIYRQN